MNLFSSHSSSTQHSQAAAWAAKLDGGPLTPPERIALETWLDKKPVHRDLLAEYRQLSARLDVQVPVLAEAGGLDLPDEPQPARWFQHRGLLTLGGLTLAGAAAAVALWLAPPASQHETIATAITQRQTVQLADGTTVELNARSNLAIEITPVSRRVRLADGEAFFVVKKDLDRPFIVETPGGLVRVTGTQFNVKAENATSLDVLVAEGSVQVRPRESDGRAAAPVALKPGGHLSAGPAGIQVETVTARALEDKLAWRQGQIVFDGSPLKEAAARFARYHGRGVNTTVAAGELRIGGRFSLDDFDGFFAAVEEILPVSVVRDSSGTVQVSLRAEPLP